MSGGCSLIIHRSFSRHQVSFMKCIVSSSLAHWFRSTRIKPFSPNHIRTCLSYSVCHRVSWTRPKTRWKRSSDRSILRLPKQMTRRGNCAQGLASNLCHLLWCRRQWLQSCKTILQKTWWRTRLSWQMLLDLWWSITRWLKFQWQPKRGRQNPVCKALELQWRKLLRKQQTKSRILDYFVRKIRHFASERKDTLL